jgi:plastocyanin
MRRRHAVLLGLALPLVAAAPATAAEVEGKAVEPAGAEPAWDKTLVAIAPGDTVVWTFTGTTQAHNVWSGASTNWSYESALATPAPPGSFRFDTTGSYHFVCRVHASMQGDVIVGNAPPPPPPPLSQQPFPNDGTPPAVPATGELVLETGGLDTTRPTLSGVWVRRARHGARVSFRVSELSRVTVRFKRGGKIVKTAKLNAAGRYRGTVRDAKRLRVARYRVVLRAEDVAGNRSEVHSARVRLR